MNKSNQAIFQTHCNGCQWRSPIQHTETLIGTNCPICESEQLQFKPVHQLDWLFEQAERLGFLSNEPSIHVSQKPSSLTQQVA